MSKYYFNTYNLFGIIDKLTDLGFEEETPNYLVDFDFTGVDLNKKTISYNNSKTASFSFTELGYKPISRKKFTELLLALQRDKKLDDLLKDV